MISGKTIAVVIPCYNEEKQIGLVLDNLPSFVDRVVVVNDASKDNTAKVVQGYIQRDKSVAPAIPQKNKELKPNMYNKADIVVQQIIDREASLYTPQEVWNKSPEKDRIILINHKKNGRKGASMATGYKWCRDNNIFCTAVMDGDAQMDPEELESLVLPIVNGEVDYVKANRLKHRSAFFVIPKLRFFGNSILSMLTKIASGYWRVSDTQSGFTAINLTALKAIRIHKIYKDYGCPNDMLVKLNIAFCSIREVESKPVYKIGEVSKMREMKLILPISFLLFKSFFKRLYVKYLFRDFHPIFLFYHFAFFLFLANLPFMVQVIKSLSPDVTLPLQSLIIFTLLSIGGFQSLFFAMWMDMMDNDRLYK